MKRKTNDFSFEKIRKKRGRAAPEHPHRTSSRDTHAGDFRCRKCRVMIGPSQSGTKQRNHCPLCLHSLHVDHRPGDRSADCGSIMEPISIWVRGDEWVLLHRCRGCGVIHSNRIAPDDSEIILLSLAARPLGRPAFPLFLAEDGADPGVDER